MYMDKSTKDKKEKTFPANVVKIIDSYTVVINRGSEHGIKEYQRFLIYTLSKEIIKDSDTGKSLGYLEIVKGTGEVKHVQPKMSTIKSDRMQKPKRKIIKSTSRGIFPFQGTSEEEIIEPSDRLRPFDGPKVGDKVKPI